MLGTKVFSCLKRRCYIHYKTEKEALSALEGKLTKEKKKFCLHIISIIDFF